MPVARRAAKRSDGSVGASKKQIEGVDGDERNDLEFRFCLAEKQRQNELKRSSRSSKIKTRVLTKTKKQLKVPLLPSAKVQRQTPKAQRTGDAL